MWEGGLPEGSQLHSLTHVVNTDDFRFYLLRWIVECHIPSRWLKVRNFQMILNAQNNTFEGYMVRSGNAIRNWVEHEFMEAQLMVRNEVLAKSRSQIHISCDLWSLPNGYAMCDVAAHFVGHTGRVQHVSLVLRRMKAAHGGRKVSEVIVSVLDSNGFAQYFSVFVADHVESSLVS